MTREDLKNINIEEFAHKIAEMLRENQVQQISASNSTLLKLIQNLTADVKANTELTQQVKENHDALVEKLKPMMDAFSESETYKFVWEKTGVKIKKYATWVSVVGGAVAIVWVGFKKIILFIRI